MPKIRIDDKEYDLDSLPEPVKQTISVMQEISVGIQNGQKDLAIKQAALTQFGTQLNQQLENVDPIAPVVVKTPPKKTPARKPRKPRATK